MASKKRWYIPYLVILFLGIVIMCLLVYILPYRYQLNTTVYYQETGRMIHNPLIGYAPVAENETACKDTELVYIGLTWADWEPQQDVYDIEAFEEKYHIRKWKQEKKHAVLRFVCDIPGKTAHRDIPEWLYQKTKDGTDYDTSSGKGYSPYYANAFFRERHKMAIEALAEYCNKDDFVAYVELGSLGHWGEWHTNTTEGATQMPNPEICWEYVLAYSDCFYNARLLMRRNYVMAAEGGHGLYHDMIGDVSQTEKWESWIKNGGSQVIGDQEIPYVPMENFWMDAPAGGEFTSDDAMSDLLGRKFPEIRGMVESLHLSFIGPKTPDGEWKDSVEAETIESLLGYRFYISQMRTHFSYADNQIEIYLTWENTGQAPIYWDWPVTMYVYDREDNLEYWETVDMRLSEIKPGQTVTTKSHIPFTDLFRQGFCIGIGITSPDRDETIELAMDCRKINEKQIIYTYQ